MIINFMSRVVLAAAVASLACPLGSQCLLLEPQVTTGIMCGSIHDINYTQPTVCSL